MTYSGVTIEYGNIARGAKENFNATANNQSNYSRIEQLKEYNFNALNYGNPCELYAVPLNGKTFPLPSDTNNLNIGYWSDFLSNDTYTTGRGYLFSTPIILTLEATKDKYTSSGLTFWFDIDNNLYPTEMKISIYNDDVILKEDLVFPDNAKFVYTENLENYNKIILTFYALNLPKNRLKIRSVDYGYGTMFFGNQLTDVKILQEFNDTMAELYLNVASVKLINVIETYYSFNEKQPLKIYFDNKLKQLIFPTSIKRKKTKEIFISGEDYVSLLIPRQLPTKLIESIDNPLETIVDIFKKANIPVQLDGVNLAVSPTREGELAGDINERSLVQELCFAGFQKNVFINTAESENLQIKNLDDNIKQKIEKKRILEIQDEEETEPITSLDLEYLSTKSVPTTELKNWERAKTISPTIKHGETIKYTHPRKVGEWDVYESVSLRDAWITVLDDYSIEFSFDSDTVYDVYINVREYKYEEITEVVYETLYNEEVEFREGFENPAKIRSALITEKAAPQIATKCYNWYIKNPPTKLKIVEGKHVLGGEYIKWGQKKWGTFKYGEKTVKVITYDEPVQLGDMIEVETDYGDNLVGRVVRQEYNLNGGIIVKDVTIR